MPTRGGFLDRSRPTERICWNPRNRSALQLLAAERGYNKSHEGAPTDASRLDGGRLSSARDPRRQLEPLSGGIRSPNPNGDRPSLQNMIVGSRVARPLP
jgi:hypothetical protein